VVARFSLFLPPSGEALLPGPEPRDLPTAGEGLYSLLLRIEASDDREADSDLTAAGAGPGVLHSGGVAGFSLPTLRYVVGSGASQFVDFVLLAPLAGRALAPGAPLDVAWPMVRAALLYRIEFAGQDGAAVFSAVVQQGIGQYRAPSWLGERLPAGGLEVRTVALGPGEREIAATPWRAATWSAGAASAAPRDRP